MSSKIEGCCCPPKGYSGIWAGALCPVHKGLRKLAAPVVERQPNPPVCVIEHGPFDDVGCPQWVRANTVGDFDLENIPNGTLLWMLPPELAELAELQAKNEQLTEAHRVAQKQLGDRWSDINELQAAIDKLTAENETLRLNLDLQHTLGENAGIEIDQLKAEIERLKGGQGEPVAYIVEAIDPNNGHIRRRGLHWHSIETLRNTRDFKEWIGENITKEQPLYTSRPAPVSVRLPERIEPPSDYAYRKGWNACLDKVKELNQ